MGLSTSSEGAFRKTSEIQQSLDRNEGDRNIRMISWKICHLSQASSLWDWSLKIKCPSNFRMSQVITLRPYLSRRSQRRRKFVKFEFFKWFRLNCQKVKRFINKIVSNDEATCTFNGTVIRHKCTIWAVTSLHITVGYDIKLTEVTKWYCLSTLCFIVSFILTELLFL